jgi:hypothetical protein
MSPWKDFLDIWDDIRKIQKHKRGKGQMRKIKEKQEGKNR